MNTESIPLASIDASNRVRAVDPDHAAQIADSMAAIGLQSPVQVRINGRHIGRYILVTGAHRLQAARMLGWEEIPATLFEGDADDARIAELDENLCRHELNALDRAAFLAERKRIYERKHPHARHGGDRSKSSTMALLLGERFTAEAAARIGCHESTIKRDLARYGKVSLLPRDIRDELAGTEIARKAALLDAFLRLPGLYHQRRTLDELAKGAKGGDALRAAFGASVPKVDNAYSRFLVLWDKANGDLRDRILKFLVDAGEVEWPAPVVSDEEARP